MLDTKLAHRNPPLAGLKRSAYNNHTSYLQTEAVKNIDIGFIENWNRCGQAFVPLVIIIHPHLHLAGDVENSAVETPRWGVSEVTHPFLIKDDLGLSSRELLEMSYPITCTE